MKYSLRDYQIPYQNGVLNQLRTKNRVILQMPTGAGKTFTAVSIIHKWMMDNPDKKVVFVAHRMELVTQFANSCKELINIDPFIVESNVVNACQNSTIYSCMVETLDNRLKADPEWIKGDVGMLVFDESHMNLFERIARYYPEGIKVVGVTATPISSNYQKPMIDFYESMVTNLSTKDVIDLGFLVPNKTYVMSNDIDMSKVKSLGDDYNNRDLFNQFRKSKNVLNTVKAYERKAFGKKALIFNCNIEHCEIVNKAFNDAGYKSKVLYGKHTPEERKDILEWFRNTPKAILQNVGVLVAGYDEPSIEAVIFNRETLSLSLWLQATGRGSRLYGGKDHFVIIDMGTNAIRLGDWNYSYDWEYMFKNPAKPIFDRKSNSSKKTCIKCEFLMDSKLNNCPECGTMQNKPNPFLDMRSPTFHYLQDFIDDKYGESYTQKYI